MARVRIFWVVVIFVAAMASCVDDTDQGTRYEPEIRDWHDLHAVRFHPGDSFVLMNDLDATTAGYQELASAEADKGGGWQPIGNQDDRFYGSFNGQGYEIRDIFIDRPDQGGIGLFGAVDEGGVVENVGVVNVNVAGEWAVGALAGANWGLVRTAYSAGSVTGLDCVGGLVGGNAGTLSDCHSAADITGHWDVGGLAGCNDSSGTVSSSYSTGSVTGEWAVGGLLGGNWGGVVNLSYSTGTVQGVDYVGGLVGDNQGTVSNSYSAGGVTGDWHVGGLVGYNEEGIVSKCYSAGNVTGDWHAGGLVGGSEGGNVNDSFWDSEACAIEESDGGTGKTTMEMHDIATFSDTDTGGLEHPWDIAAVAPGESDRDRIWNIVDGQTYPFLSWSAVDYEASADLTSTSQYLPCDHGLV